jgi:hypothetical protein
MLDKKLIEISRPKDLDEVKILIHLSLVAFNGNDHENKIISLWNSNWLKNPISNPLDSILIKYDGEIIGGIRISKFDLFFNLHLLRCISFSEIFINSKFRGNDFSKILINSAIEKIKMLDFDLILVNGRRNIDGLYFDYGFRGISYYPSITLNDIQVHNKINKFHKNTIYEICQIKKNEDSNISLINNVYNLNYRGINGSFLRNSLYWNFLFSKNGISNSFRIFTIRHNNNYGYFILMGSSIVEIAVDTLMLNASLIHSITIYLNINSLNFLIPNNHPLICELSSYDITISNRYCEYGGYVGLPLNKANLLSRFNMNNILSGNFLTFSKFDEF